MPSRGGFFQVQLVQRRAEPNRTDEQERSRREKRERGESGIKPRVDEESKMRSILKYYAKVTSSFILIVQAKPEPRRSK